MEVRRGEARWNTLHRKECFPHALRAVFEKHSEEIGRSQAYVDAATEVADSLGYGKRGGVATGRLISSATDGRT